MAAEWHFFASPTEKGPCDGDGGSVKQLATRASLQEPNDEHMIQTPSQLYNWATTAMPQVSFSFVLREEVAAEEDKVSH